MSESSSMLCLKGCTSPQVVPILRIPFLFFRNSFFSLVPQGTGAYRSSFLEEARCPRPTLQMLPWTLVCLPWAISPWCLILLKHRIALDDDDYITKFLLWGRHCNGSIIAWKCLLLLCVWKSSCVDANSEEDQVGFTLCCFGILTELSWMHHSVT